MTRAVLIPVLSASLSICGGAAGAQVSDAFQATTLNGSAFGEVKARPDIATLTLGVSTEAETAGLASQENARRMEQVLAAVRKAGVKEADIRTAGLSLNPRYRNVPNQPAEQTGYQASNTVAVTVRDIAKAGGLLDAAVAAGANQVRGVSFRLENPAVAETRARREAVKALEAKAALYARETGYRVTRLVQLNEGGAAGFIPPFPVPAAARASDMAVTGSSVAPGELTVRINVSAVYELAKP